MKTMMYSDIIRRDIELLTDSNRAKIVDITADKREKYWVSHGIIIETGFLDSKAKYYPNTSIHDIPSEGAIRLESTEGKKKREDKWLLSKIKGKKIMKDKTVIGRVYDFEIFTDRNPWVIWKLFVNPIGISPMKRRTKIRTSSIEEYENGKLSLKSDWNRGVRR